MGKMNRADSIVLSELQRHVGRPNAVGRYPLLQQVNRALRDPLSERELRAIIHDLREKGEPICSAGGVGYWYPANPKEVMETADELESKAKSMLRIKSVVKRAGILKFGRQQELL